MGVRRHAIITWLSLLLRWQYDVVPFAMEAARLEIKRSLLAPGGKWRTWMVGSSAHGMGHKQVPPRGGA